MPFPADTIARVTGSTVVRSAPLAGGSIAAVYRVELADGRVLVAKASPTPANFDLEARMLAYLREYSALPVPEVLHSQPDLLLMTFLRGDSTLTPPVQEHAADLLAALHRMTAPRFGLEFDTLMGGLHQPNTPSDTWISFFREQRLLYMANQAVQAGELPAGLLRRIEALAARLETWLIEPSQPALIHGDMWTTNILAHQGRVTGFIDPAIYYAHPEIELAFSTLFGTFDNTFFRRYHELSPIAPGFFEERRDIYNLYPLLVHVRLFGGGYVASVDGILRKFGA